MEGTLSYCDHPQCSKPLFSPLEKWHNFLCGKSDLYHAWHHHPHHKKVHFGIATLSIITAVSFVLANIIMPIQQAQAATATWDFSHDNSQYEYNDTKISTTGNKATLSNPGAATSSSVLVNPRSGVSSDAAAHFSSANKEYLTIPSNASLQTGDIDFEVGLWVYLDTAGSSQGFIQKYSTSSNKEYVLGYKASVSRFEFTVSSDGSATQSIDADNFGAPSATTWYFLRAYHDSVNNKIGIQVNNGTANTLDYSSGVKTGGTSPVDFGIWLSGNYMNGRMDSAYFKKSVSTADEATALYNAGGGRTYADLILSNGLANFKTALTSWWGLNEESGTRYDSNGTNHLTSAADQIMRPQVLSSTELILNPGYETAGAGDPDFFANLSETAGDGAIANEGSLVKSGSHALKITTGVTKNTNAARVYQTVSSLAAGQVYYYSFWTRGDGTNASRIRIKDNTNSPDIIALTSTGITSTTYSLVSGSFTIPAGCVQIVFYLYGPAINGGIGYFDDVSLKLVTTAGVLNGGFEYLDAANNFTTWSEETGGTGTVIDETTIINSGVHAAKLSTGASATTDKAKVNMSPIVTIGRKYKFTAYARSDSGAPVMKGGDIASANQSSFTLSTSYAQYTGYFTATNTYFYLTNSTANSIIYIDTVTLESIGPLSEAGIAAGVATDGNYAAQFDGTQSLLLTDASGTSALNPGTSDFTLSTNVYMDSSVGAKGLFTKGASSGSLPGYDVFIGPTSQISIRFGDGSAARISKTFTTVLAPNNWYSIILNFTRNGNAELFINGVSDGTVAISAQSGSSSNTSNLVLGYSAAQAAYMKGRLDSPFIIKRTLTTQEITAVVNNGRGLKYFQLPDSIKTDANLKAFWNLDEKSGVRYDSTANANNLTDNGGVTQGYGPYYNEGVVAKINDLSGNNKHFTQTTISKRPTYDSLGIGSKPAMVFDGTDDALAKTGDQIGTGDVTVTAVIKPRGWGGSNNYGTVIANNKFMLRVNSAGTINFMSDNVTASSSSNGSIVLGTPYVITITHTSVGTANIYINGALSGAADQSSGTPAAGSDTYIGNRAAGDRAFDGWIGPVMIQNSILDPIQRNNIEKTLGAEYGITVADQAGTNAGTSIYPTLATKSPLRYSSLTSIAETMDGSSTGTLRYQLSNDSNSDNTSATYYWYNGSAWAVADKNNAYQSNTVTEINSNLATFPAINPSYNFKWRSFFITDGVDNPSLSTINLTYVSDTEAPDNPASVTAKNTLGGSTTLTTGHWYNYPTPSFSWTKPSDNAREFETSSGVAGYLVYFGTDNTANIGLGGGLVNIGQNNGAFTWQNTVGATETFTNASILANGQTYYLKIISVDNAGNPKYKETSSDYNLFTYKYDTDPPTAIDHVNVAQVGCSPSPGFDFTWSASGDTTSSIDHYEYKVGIAGTVHTVSGISVDDVAPARENENVFYVRPVDAAGNALETWQSVVFCSTQAASVSGSINQSQTLSSITVSFETSQQTSAKLEVFNLDDSKAGEKIDDQNSYTHELTVDRLHPNTTYRYKITYKDQSNTEYPGSLVDFTTDLVELKNVVSANTSNSLSQVEISYETTKPTKGRLEIFDTSVNEKFTESSESDFSLNHKITINNLKSDKEYSYNIYYTDQEGNNYTSNGHTFRTDSVSIPSDPIIVSGPSSLKVTWKTNKPATGQVQIRDGDTYREPQGHIDFRTDHEVSILGLKAGKSYEIKIIWEDETGVKHTSKAYTSNTAESPSIKDLKAEIISPTSVLVSWETNYTSECEIDYDNAGTFSKKINIEGSANAFSKKIESLEAGSVYQFKIKAATTDGAEFTSIASAQMPPLPIISNLRFEPALSGARASYRATWDTNIAASSAVYYRIKGQGDYKVVANPDFILKHENTVPDFQDQSEYELYAFGRDKYGNEAKSDINTITTPLDSRPPKISNLTTEVKSAGFGDTQKAQIIVTWETDEPATSQIEYGLGISGQDYANKSKEDNALSTSHAVIVSELEPSKIYHLRAVSKDKAGNLAYSEDTTTITGKIQKSVIDIIISSLQKSLGFLYGVFK